jgi:superfamily I DNA/RNA helicase
MPEDAEEKRIAFVALTRAQRYCLVAVPDDTRGRAAAVAFGKRVSRPSADTVAADSRNAEPIQDRSGFSAI